MNIRVAIKGNTDNDTVQELIATSKVVAEASEGEYVIKALMKDSVTSIIKVMNDTAFIVITEDSLAGFLAHPRNGVVRGFQFPGHSATREPFYGIAHTGKGYKEENNVVTDLGDDEGAQVGIPFPLADNSNTVYHFNLDDDQWTAEGPQELMYGNVDWKGPKGDDPSQRKILTYKGNPSRYWPIGNFVEIPGLSSVDHSVDGLLNSYEYMTVFGDKVYEGGQILATMPWLYHPLNTVQGGWEENHQNAQVLGAAIRQSDGLLICIVKTCYNSYPRLKAASDQEGFLVSAWHTYKDGVVYKDWLDDKSGAEKQVYDSQGDLALVEVPDPGRGYFVELIIRKAGNVPGGWTRLHRETTGTAWANCNFFFSEDGTKAVSVQLGEIWKYEISEGSVVLNKAPVGGFKNAIVTTSTSTNKSVPWSAATQPKDFKNHSKTVRKYTATKSGSLIIAADYKNNELVTATATMSGSDTWDQTKEFSAYWGETAVMSELHSSTFDRILKEPNPHLFFSCEESEQGCAQASVAGSACQAVCTVEATNMTLLDEGEDDPYDGKSNAPQGCRQVWKINEECVQTGRAEACITTTTTAKNGTAVRTDCIIMSGLGTWTGEWVYVGPNGWYWDEEPDGATRIRHYVFQWINIGYDMCSNGRCAEEAALAGGTVLSCSIGYCIFEILRTFTYICD